MIPLPANHYPWAVDARCAEIDPDLFFPENLAEADAARRICRTCPARQHCLTVALTDPSLTGVWGGTTLKERRILRLTTATRRRTQ